MATKKSSSKSSVSIPKLEVDNNSSINVRKIENGFLVSENGYTGKGRNQQYYSKEFYSKTNPVANIVKPATGKNFKIGK